MAKGRPKKIKVKIANLLKYLNDLPENHPTRQKLSPDKMLIIQRYVEELAYLETQIAELKMDIHEHGTVELFEQGTQKLRRQNPSCELYFSCWRQYRMTAAKINELLYNIVVVW